MPWFPLYAADFMMDTATWTDEEVGAYFRLLCHQWINGEIPAEHERLARLVWATPQRLADLWTVLGPKFQDPGDGRLRNARLERERRTQATQSQARSERARKAAAARWGSDDEAVHDSCTEQSGEQCSSIASQSQSQSQIQKLDSDSEAEQTRLPSVASCPPTPANGRTGQAEPKVVEWVPIKGSLPQALSHGPVQTGAHGPEYGVTEDRVAEWESLYPGVDVRQQLRSIRGWNAARPRNRKTYPKGGGSGVLGHIDSWLRRSQDRARPEPGNGSNHHPNPERTGVNASLASRPQPAKSAAHEAAEAWLVERADDLTREQEDLLLALDDLPTAEVERRFRQATGRDLASASSTEASP